MRISDDKFLAICDGELLINVYGDYNTSIKIVKMPRSRATSITSIYNFTSAKKELNSLIDKTFKSDMKADYIETINVLDDATSDVYKLSIFKVYNEKSSIVFYGHGKNVIESIRDLFKIIGLSSKLFVDECMVVNEDYAESIGNNKRQFIGRYTNCIGNDESFDIIVSNGRFINGTTKDEISRDCMNTYVNMITKTNACGPLTIRTYKSISMYYLTVYAVCNGFTINGFGRTPFESIINAIDNMASAKSLQQELVRPKKNRFEHHRPHRGNREEVDEDTNKKYYTNHEDEDVEFDIPVVDDGYIEDDETTNEDNSGFESFNNVNEDTDF